MMLPKSATASRLDAAVGSGSYLSRPLPPELGPVIQPLPDLALEAALGRIVEGLAAQALGEIVLAGKRIRRIVVVFIAGAVAFVLHQARGRVEDVLGRQQRARFLGDALRRAKGRVGGVGF